MQAETICGNDIEGLDADTLIPVSTKPSSLFTSPKNILKPNYYHQVEIVPCDVSPRQRSQDAFSIVELGKQLLISARNGDTETVRDLMCRGAPFTTDWVRFFACLLEYLESSPKA